MEHISGDSTPVGPITMSEEQFDSLSALSAEEFDQLWLIAARASVNRPEEPLPIRSEYKDNLFHYVNVAVESYNSNHQSNQYEVVDPLVYARAGTANYHLSFIARSKDDSSILKLFFADVSSSRDATMARKCIIVEPCNPFFVIGCDHLCHPEGAIYHPFNYRDHFDYVRTPLAPRSREHRAKRFLSEAYVITSYEENLNAEEVEQLRITTDEYIREALRMYNEEHCADFKPLGIVASVRFGWREPYMEEALWVHFIFKATNKYSVLTDASPTYFFAERAILSEYTTTCVIIGDSYPSSAYPRTETSCAVCRVHCPSMIFHPEGYNAGRDGGNFADALDKDKSRMVKTKLEEKDGDSSKLARLEYLEALKREW